MRICGRSLDRGFFRQSLSGQELVIGRDRFLPKRAVREALGKVRAGGAVIDAHQNAALVVLPGEVGLPIHPRPCGISVLLQLVIDGFEVFSENLDGISGPPGP
jgi:hypothetical protein